MPLRLAILGLDPIQRDWLDAVSALANTGEIEVHGIGHRSLAAAKDIASVLRLPGNNARTIPTYDDLRLLLKDAAPQVILLDRPPNVTIDFLMACIEQNIALLSLGPPVESFAEAQTLAAHLTPKSHLLYIWPRFADAPASQHCAQADDFVRPIRFAAATWMGVNHALAKALPTEMPLPDLPVRSLSVLAWDALATLIRLIDVPTSVFAAVRGTVGSGNTFSDVSGAASLTLRFPDDAAASLTLCDRAPAMIDRPGPTASSPWNKRDLLLWGAGGTLKLDAHLYEFRDPEGNLIDAGGNVGTVTSITPPAQSPTPATTQHSLFAHGTSIAPPRLSPALQTLREFLRQYTLPPSPHRGWEHRLEDVAATMEALIVSHRTGQAESPERFRRLRR
jgi:predicted dehydrogenase